MRKLFVVLAVLTAISTVANARSDHLYKIHFRKLAVPHGQRVAAISLKLACAHISNVDGIPDDWSVQTVRAISAVEEFHADAGHGASWLGDLKLLDGVITVIVPSDSASCFSISGTILTEDDDKQHKLAVHFSDIRLKPRH